MLDTRRFEFSARATPSAGLSNGSRENGLRFRAGFDRLRCADPGCTTMLHLPVAPTLIPTPGVELVSLCASWTRIGGSHQPAGAALAAFREQHAGAMLRARYEIGSSRPRASIKCGVDRSSRRSRVREFCLVVPSEPVPGEGVDLLGISGSEALPARDADAIRELNECLELVAISNEQVPLQKPRTYGRRSDRQVALNRARDRLSRVRPEPAIGLLPPNSEPEKLEQRPCAAATRLTGSSE